MIIECHKTYDRFLTKDLISQDILTWITGYYGLDTKVLYDDIINAIQEKEDLTNQALLDVPDLYKDEFIALVDDIRNSTVLYFSVPYKVYDSYDEAFEDYMNTIQLTPSEVVDMVQDMLKQRNYVVELDHDIIHILFDKIEVDESSIAKYDPSKLSTAFIASIQLPNKQIEDMLKGTTFKKIYGTKITNGYYDHLNSNQLSKINHSMTLANSRSMDICDFMLITNPTDMKDYIDRSIYLEAAYMLSKNKNVYILNRYIPATFWGRALTELDNILTIEGDFDKIVENRVDLSKPLINISVTI